MNERNIRQTVARIRHKRGKEAAQIWAFERGYAVRWSRDGIDVRPLV